MTIDALVRRDVVVLSPTSSCQQAAALMRDRNVGCVVVVQDEEPVGIVTDRDLVTRVLAAGRDHVPRALELTPPPWARSRAPSEV